MTTHALDRMITQLQARFRRLQHASGLGLVRYWHYAHGVTGVSVKSWQMLTYPAHGAYYSSSGQAWNPTVALLKAIEQGLETLEQQERAQVIPRQTT